MRFHKIALLGLLTPDRRRFVEKMGQITVNDQGDLSSDSSSVDEKVSPADQKLLQRTI